MLPRLTPRALPDNAAQVATNARLLSGDLEAWRQFSTVHVLAMSAPVDTIYVLNGAALSWAGDVDAARGPVPGDTTFRLFLTGPAVYDVPQWTNYALATGGAEPYPVATRLLGVPAPPTGFVIANLVTHALFTFYVPASGIEPGAITDYVVTYVNDIGEESAPSLPLSSNSGAPTLYAISGSGDYNEVGLSYPVNMESATDGYDVVTMRLYRAATGSAGSAFRFVADIPLASFTYFDEGDDRIYYYYEYQDFAADTALGEVLPSTLWDLPPANLQGLLALPNGVMSGFAGNQLCFSAQNHPHAWPVDWQLTTDTDIVAIGNIDTTVVVFTKSFLYVASGSDPSQYSMAKFEIPRAGVAKRSIAYLRNTGVVGATSLGLVAVQGVGQMVELTETIFTYQQWQALNPSSIIAFGHNNIYFFFYDTGSVKGGYALDMSPSGFGLIALSFHATAGYNDPETDRLYLVLDQINEPTDPNLVLSSTAPTPDGRTIYEFDSPTGSGHLVFRYRGKLNVLARPAAFQAAQVRANDFTNLVLNTYANGAQLTGAAITAESEFTMPTGNEYTVFEVEIVGTSSVRDNQFSESMDELA